MRTPRTIFSMGLVAATAAACGSSSEEPAAENAQERRALLTSVTDHVIVPGFERFVASAAALSAAVDTYAAAVGTPTVDDARSTAQAAFRAAYADMQYAELLQIGPYGSSARFAGGQNLRDEVYSWPAVNACQIDQKLVEGDYDSASFFTNSLFNVYGFDALEYLLFYDSATNNCAEPVRINRDGTWNAIAGELQQRRADYAAAVAENISVRVRNARDAWNAGFGNELSGAGASSSVYSTAQAGLDALFASMFYLEKSVKDTKLANPLGISASCAQEVCPELLESRYAELSATAVQANIQAFRDLFLGGPNGVDDRYGFGDLLRDSNAEELGDELESLLTTMSDRMTSVSDPMSQALGSEPPRALHTAVRNFTTIMKSQFVSVLALRVPNEGAADND